MLLALTGACRKRETPAKAATPADLVVLARLALSEDASFRQTAARVSGLPEHRPARRLTRDAKPSTSGANTNSAALRVFAYDGELDASAHRARALSWLSANRVDAAAREIRLALNLGSTESVDAAVDSATDATLLVDAAAVHYARYEQRRDAGDLLVALAAALRAYELAPQSAEVLWNRALLVDELGLIAEARAAWNEYLRVDGRSAWAAEARQRRSQLPERPAYAQDPARAAALLSAQQTGEASIIRSEAAVAAATLKQTVEGAWIPAWAAAVLSNDGTAPSRLRAIAVAGDAIRDRANDPLIATFAASAIATPRFAAPHARIGTVGKILRQRGTEAALETSIATLRELREVRSPMAPVIAVGIAGLQYHAYQHRAALATLEAVEPELRAAASPLTNAKAAWARGVALTSLGAVRPAAESYRRSMELFGAAGDVSQVGPLQMLLADNAELAGEFDEMWTRHFVAVREGERHSDEERIRLILSTFCRAAVRRENLRLADLLNEALLDRAVTPDALPYRTQGLVTRCELLARRKKLESAQAQCADARAAWASIADAAVRARLEADLETATAAADHFDSENALTRAVDGSLQRHDLYRLSRVLQLRGRAYAAQGAMKLAEKDFEGSLRALEEQRGQLNEVRDKMAYFETSRTVAEDLIHLLIVQNRFDDALEVVERVRARALVDRLTLARGRAPAALQDVLKTLPAGEAMVVYWCAPSETYLWVLSRRGIRFHRQLVARTKVAAATRQLVISLSTNPVRENDHIPPATFLYDTLVAPLNGDLAGIDTITFVPDVAMSAIPYSALRNRQTGRYVIHDYAIARAASATAYALRPAAAPSRSLLMIMNPAVATLAPLDVDQEIRAGVEAIPRSAVFTRDTATESTLRDLAPEHAVIHIAAHGLDDAYGESALALTGDPLNDGTLTVPEVETLRVRAGALIILGSCGSASGRQTTEGVLSLARAFTSAGARSVVAALWDAADQDSGRLLAGFYKALQTSRTPAHALRTAQLAALQTPRFSDPRHWAAYQLEGGS